MNYQILNIKRDGNVMDISPLVSTIQWSGDIREAARKLNISMVYSSDYYTPKYDIELGSIVVLKNDGKEIIRGVVFDNKKSTDGLMQIQSFDHAIYLLNSEASFKYTNATPEGIIRDLCGKFGIQVGSIAPTGVTLPKLLLRDMTIYDMMITALTEATKRNGKKYQIRFNEGKLNVIEKGLQKFSWLIKSGENLLEATSSKSIGDMRNRIIIVGDKDQVLAEVRDDSLIKMYGLLQKQKKESDITTGEAQLMAKNLLKELAKVSQEATVTALGIDEVRAGDSIEVEEQVTGLKGTYYVDSDNHSVDGSNHTMVLKLNWTDDVATKEAKEE